MSVEDIEARKIPAILLSPEGPGRKLQFEQGQKIFCQGDTSDSIYVVMSGLVRLSVMSPAGRQATVALLGRYEVLGEQCLARGKTKRLMTARAISATELVKIGLDAVRALLATDLEFANFVLQGLIARTGQYEQALVHHIINNTERRLARALLHLSQYNGIRSVPIKHVSQETLAEMVGASRSRINGFMTKFRRLGYVEYSGSRILVKPSLVSVLFQAPRTISE